MMTIPPRAASIPLISAAITFRRLMDNAGALHEISTDPSVEPPSATNVLSSIPSVRKQCNASRTQTPMVRASLRHGMTAVKTDAFI
jgi:hypothetical protein